MFLLVPYSSVTLTRWQKVISIDGYCILCHWVSLTTPTEAVNFLTGVLVFLTGFVLAC